MPNDIDVLFSQNEVQIGESKDFKTTPPLYYQSLNDAFYNYFRTVKNNKDMYHSILNFQQLDRKSMTINFRNADSTVFAILGFHRFFELLIKDILRRVNPYLAVKLPGNEDSEIKYLNKEMPAEELDTVEFQKAFNRLKEAIKYSNENPKKIKYRMLKRFSFLKDDDTLTRLTRWRNRIMHNGNTIPNIYLLDYLVSQRIVPLVVKVIKADKAVLGKYFPHYFETYTHIKIVEEMHRIKFDFREFGKAEKRKQLAKKYSRLAHLKEFGRAAYGLEFTLKNNISFSDPYYEDPIGRNIRFAEQERSQPLFHNLKSCPCCGYATLVVYRKDTIPGFSEENFISWFNCFTCSYSLKNNVQDPYHFGFCKERLFATG